ncbi:hypothetical protein HS088_TW17G01074 [Tripterygium wilfordii]|uniref:Plastocyanin-like domain-containing protein n=2 Tax=Tripterygium wilfordii TaxID=458696 RepID=A0A7J7CHN0_TRIWF|nr:hypothetical protein HS088_TW17G01074 [Tripterygium wilfordii]
MANLATSFTLWLSLLSYSYINAMAQWPAGRSTRFYEFKVQTMRMTKLCNTNEIVAVNNMFPGPVIYAQEDDRVTVKVTNASPYNASIHW